MIYNGLFLSVAHSIASSSLPSSFLSSSLLFHLLSSSGRSLSLIHDALGFRQLLFAISGERDLLRLRLRLDEELNERLGDRLWLRELLQSSSFLWSRNSRLKPFSVGRIPPSSNELRFGLSTCIWPWRNLWSGVGDAKWLWSEGSWRWLLFVASALLADSSKFPSLCSVNVALLASLSTMERSQQSS